MKLIFNYDGNACETTVTGPMSVTFYAVPASYSDDGLYLATWASGEYEPVPACAASEARLLARLAVERSERGELYVREFFCAPGVDHASA